LTSLSHIPSAPSPSFPPFLLPQPYLLRVAAGDILVERRALTGRQARRLVVQQLSDAGRVLKVMADAWVGAWGKREGRQEGGNERSFHELRRDCTAQTGTRKSTATDYYPE